MEILNIEGLLALLDNQTLTSIINCCQQTHQNRLKFIKYLKFDREKSLKLYETRPEGWNLCHTLDLSRSNVSDVSMLENVNTLNLAYTEITDVSMLKKVYNLCLAQTKITDVSMLKNVHDLNLTRTEVKDVSMLKNVHNLCLSHTKVTDVSMLKNVRILDLLRTKVTDVSMLKNVRYLNLNGTTIPWDEWDALRAKGIVVSRHIPRPQPISW